LNPQQKPRRKKKRSGLGIALITALIVLGLAITGIAIVKPQGLSDLLRTDGTPSTGPSISDAASTPVLTAVDAQAPAPTAAKLKSMLDKTLDNAGIGPVKASVIDVATGKELYDHGADIPATPASTNKLLTATAVLEARGPDYRITTNAVAGTNGGEVVLVGAGDPTLGVGPATFYAGAGRLDLLAAQVKQALGGVAPTKVIVDSTLFPGSSLAAGWDSDAATGGYGAPIKALMVDGARTRAKHNSDPHTAYARSANPDTAAGVAFAKLLGLPSSAVTRGTAPQDAHVLGSVSSPTVASMVEMMLSESDNVIAEAMSRQVALAKGGRADFAGGAKATIDVLTELGANPGQIKLSDGSGLSRNDTISPATQTYLLALAAGDKHPELRSLFAGLPVGGWSGTLHDRFIKKESAGGAGVIRAKTGTLSGVNAISGIVVTKDGRLLAFALLADQVPVGQDLARDTLDGIANSLALCGCR
jgi:D-alanyl-D-alanine carboxypeptidase/D-alanyl-D-alanine-endopeptidase (penicillin-binding protein 4)